MPADSTATASPLFSSEDGMFDVSTFMEGRYGFLPIPFPITEPAVGYGGGVMLVFIDTPRAAAQAGFGTDDGSAKPASDGDEEAETKRREAAAEEE